MAKETATDKRRAAINALSVSKDTRARDVVMAALNDIDPDTRRAAFMVARNMPGEERVKYLAAIVPLLTQPDDDSRAFALDVIRFSRDPKLPELLRPVLAYPDSQLRIRLFNILSFIPNPILIPVLATALTDDSPSVRMIALRGLLNNRSNEQAMTALLTVAEKGDPDMRRTLFEGLPSGNIERALSIPVLIAALTDDSATVRMTALRGLLNNRG